MTTIYVVDAFTKTVGQGNRAGVVLDADHLSESEMQAIAAFAGFSETAFVLSGGEGYGVHVRYFTPTKEVPICGHATIATHFIRARHEGIKNTTTIAKTGAGILPVDIEDHDGEIKVIMTQGKPSFLEPITGKNKAAMLDALGLTEEDLCPGLPIQIVDAGHSKIMIPIKSVKKLDSLRPNFDALAAVSEKVGCNGFFPFVIDKNNEATQTFGRMFAPAIGINEDPVTGNANGPAGAYMAHHGILKFDENVTYQGHQGIAMGKPGTVEVRLTRTPDSLKIQVAGTAVEAALLTYEATNI